MLTILKKIQDLQLAEKLFGISITILSALVVAIGPYLLAVSLLVFVDLLTGTKAARKKGHKIHSKGLRRSISKIIDYFLAILLSEIMSRVFFQGLPITYLTATFIGLIEFKSNLENIGVTSGADIWNRVKFVFPERLRSLITKNNVEPDSRGSDKEAE